MEAEYLLLYKDQILAWGTRAEMEAEYLDFSTVCRDKETIKSFSIRKNRDVSRQSGRLTVKQ